MENTLANSYRSNISLLAAFVSLIMAAVALKCLVGLHVLSPEFDPSYRVVSEYALGSHGWLLSLMFVAWALSSWTLAVALHSQVKTLGGRIGLVFLIIAGVGEALGAAFDVTWPRLHGLAGLLGVPTLPIAAALISISLGHVPAWASAKRWLFCTAILTWLSLGVLAAAIMTLTRGIGGIQVPIGWPNRLLVGIYNVWVMSAAFQAIRLSRAASRPL